MGTGRPPGRPPKAQQEEILENGFEGILIRDLDKVEMLKSALSTAVDQVNDLETLIFNSEIQSNPIAFKIGKLYVSIEIMMKILGFLPPEEESESRKEEMKKVEDTISISLHSKADNQEQFKDI
jgi:hypothetical protein